MKSLSGPDYSASILGAILVRLTLASASVRSGNGGIFRQQTLCESCQEHRVQLAVSKSPYVRGVDPIPADNMSGPLTSTIPHGATWSHFYIPVSDTRVQDILLSFPDDTLFKTQPHPYFGSTIGRVANRIANGKLTNLNGKDYTLSINEATDHSENTHHGGEHGWSKQEWSSLGIVSEGTWDEGIMNLRGGSERIGTAYALVSNDGDNGFPGKVHAKVSYFEGRGPRFEIVLDIEYEARLDKHEVVDATVISMTNHAYFNLNGPAEDANVREQEWNLGSHTASLSTSTYLALGPEGTGIPTGNIEHHSLVPWEPDVPFSLIADSGKTRDIDDCFVLPDYLPGRAEIPLDTRALPLQTLIEVKGEISGIKLKVQSTEPAFQLYTGKYTEVGPYQGGKGYGAYSGFCVEPSRFVNAAGRQDWRAQVLLKKGDVYGSRNRYVAWKEQ